MYKKIIYFLLLFTHISLAYSDDGFEFLNGLFTKPVQTWVTADKGSLEITGGSSIYGFSSGDITSDNQISARMKKVITPQYENLCYVGNKDSNPSGYHCTNSSEVELLQLNSIPSYSEKAGVVPEVSFKVNSSSKNELFNNMSGGNSENDAYLINLEPDNYNSISITGSGFFILKEGSYLIKKLSLTNDVKLILPEGSDFEIENIETNSWGGDSRIKIISYARKLYSNTPSLSGVDIALYNGNYEFNKLSLANDSNLTVEAENLQVGELITNYNDKLSIYIKNTIFFVNKFNHNGSSFTIKDGSFFVGELVANGAEINWLGERNCSNFILDDFNLSGGVNNVYMDKGVYYIKRYDNGSSSNNFKYEDSVHIISNKVDASGAGKEEDSRVSFIVLDDDEGNNASFNMSGSATSCTNIFSHRKVTLTGGVVLRGAVIANEISVTAGASIEYYPGKGCNSDAIDDDEYTLTMDTDDYYALLCKDPGLNITLTVKNGEHIAYDYNDTIDVTVKSLSSPSYPIKGDVTGNYRPVNGQLTLKLTSQGSQDVEVIAQLNPKGNSHSVSATYHFVPYKFAAEDQYVIANKPENVAVKVLGCDTDDKVIDIGYNGQPTVTSEWQAPLNGVGNVTFSPNFNAGNVTADSQKLVMEESGIRTVTMTDANFDCSNSNCPIEGGGPLQGSFTVYSRPWTFAICSSDGKSMDGNIEDRSSVGFTSAGSPFDLHIRPLRWVSSSGDNSDPQVGDREIETSAYCSSPVTQNFFATDASLEAKVLLTHNVSEPEDGNNGALSGSLALSNHAGIKSDYLPFDHLSWDEVGVLRVNADLEGKYLGMTVNQGYRNIGRFYPDHLEIISNDWKYADDHDGFVYMNQTIPYSFTVEAQNKQGKATANYSAFSEPLIVNIELLAVKELEDGRVEELNDRIKDYHLQSWNGLNEYGLIAWSGAQLSISSNNFTFSKKQQSASPYITSVDGPYQSGFGLRVTDKVDDVDFTSLDLASNTAKQFTTQPDIRYGRMRLMDVGGTSVEPIAVPLRVEFWQGSRFVSNTQDNGSTFSTDENLICKQMIWSYSDKASLSKLSGAAGQVAQGESSAIKAEPSSDTENIREQVRFWLRLDDGDTNDDSQQRSAQVGETSIECPSGYLKQPWLRYNWRAKGDEDPSAVVTFGIFRGNDRVIFRGEPGLTGH
ncbi:MSHA biogenesis protein MshQ [Vibrio metschnikovii]|nr:MSHA biogenesis protein MshQ [Vibrio metschnikovii]EKO3621591.1 MSHA biogenesis protein MshQ [Vibrio metschnikovii]EKO3622635.1 MSHA biogenesis protein MshQ [Vibrio metschnikovii]EKO3624717.1 MSHA biogenesis protein MshQ [Vibrio metschnikovii]EKO3625902.1 MSHA biogenesis protein MshQ [Vibrio metschnikovii]